MKRLRSISSSGAFCREFAGKQSRFERLPCPRRRLLRSFSRKSRKRCCIAKPVLCFGSRDAVMLKRELSATRRG